MSGLVSHFQTCKASNMGPFTASFQIYGKKITWQWWTFPESQRTLGRNRQTHHHEARSLQHAELIVPLPLHEIRFLTVSTYSRFKSQTCSYSEGTAAGTRFGYQWNVGQSYYNGALHQRAAMTCNLLDSLCFLPSWGGVTQESCRRGMKWWCRLCDWFLMTKLSWDEKSFVLAAADYTKKKNHLYLHLSKSHYGVF